MNQYKRMMPVMVFCTLLVVGLSGCAVPSPMDATDAIQGTWTSDQSVAVYDISMVGGEMTVSGYSSLSGRQMVIGDISWDGNTLEFTSYMPATDRRVEHINHLIDPNTMESTAIGDTRHTVIWKKNR